MTRKTKQTKPAAAPAVAMYHTLKFVEQSTRKSKFYGVVKHDGSVMDADLQRRVTTTAKRKSKQLGYGVRAEFLAFASVSLKEARAYINKHKRHASACLGTLDVRVQ